jgi:esterase
MDGGASSAPSTAPSAPPLVLIHGLLGSGTNFRSIQLKIKGRPSYSVDLRNHGKSPHTHDVMTLDTLAADVAKVIEERCGGQAVDVLGHSLGGKTAMMLALQYPHLIRKLIVVDIAPKSYDTTNVQWKTVEAIVAAANDLNPDQYTNRAQIDAVLAQSVKDDGVRSFVAQNLVPLPNGRYSWRINLPALLKSMRTFAVFPEPPPSGPFAPVENETHFIVGSKSTYALPSDEDRIRAFFPSVTMHSINAGHWVHADQPQAFFQLVSQILQLPQ